MLLFGIPPCMRGDSRSGYDFSIGEKFPCISRGEPNKATKQPFSLFIPCLSGGVIPMSFSWAPK